MKLAAQVRRDVAIDQVGDPTQEQLAFDCGLHRTYISGVERGIRDPTVVVLDKIARALKVKVERLVAS
jgi:transcriptional regulator with XRE-family HTH domain